MSALADWTRSTACSMGTCVEVRHIDGMVEVRDTRYPGPVLHITPEDWAAFIAGAKNGEFDLPAAVPDTPAAELAHLRSQRDAALALADEVDKAMHYARFFGGAPMPGAVDAAALRRALTEEPAAGAVPDTWRRSIDHIAETIDYHRSHTSPGGGVMCDCGQAWAEPGGPIAAHQLHVAEQIALLPGVAPDTGQQAATAEEVAKAWWAPRHPDVAPWTVLPATTKAEYVTWAREWLDAIALASASPSGDNQ